MKQTIGICGLALALLLTACGAGGGTAASMHLRRTEGTVAVADGEGRDLTPKENLGLYSGYQVDTETESYAWIDLDSAKLTKLDQNSEIEIKQEDKLLEIEVKSGSLFFNIIEPLAEDETLNIRSSTMAVGIRGTCGWVRVGPSNEMTVYLLEGTVACTAGERTAELSAGEMAALTEDGQVETRPFTAEEIPDFVRREVQEDESLRLPDLFPAPPDEISPAEGRVIDSGKWEDISATGENIIICGSAVVENVSATSGSIKIFGSAVAGNISTTSGEVNVFESAVAGDISTTSGSVKIFDSAVVGNVSTTSGNVEVYGSAVAGTVQTIDGTVQVWEQGSIASAAAETGAVQ